MTRYVAVKAYSDRSAIILDLYNMDEDRLTKSQLINNCKSIDILGVSISGNNVKYIKTYNVIEFPIPKEARQYLDENRMSSRYLHEVNTQDGIKYFVIEPDYEMPVEVYYVVRYWTEYQKTYIVDSKGYSNYFSSAKKFYNASDAFAIATQMTKNSKAGNIWKAVRVEDGVEME